MTETAPATNDDARSDKLDRILRLAEAERSARESPRWKTAIEDAIETHGAACDRLYDELYRQLDERKADGKPVPKYQSPPDPREEMRKKITRALKAELPGIIAAAVEDVIDQA